MAVKRSLGFSIILVLIIAGMAHAQLDTNGTTLCPLRPNFLRKASEIKEIRDK